MLNQRRNSTTVILMLLVLFMCFTLFTACTDDDKGDGDTSGSAESDGIISEDETNDDTEDESLDITDDISPDESPDNDISPDESPDISIDNDVSELISFPMTFEKVSESLYRMECVAPDGNTLRLTFNKKSWGTYNIGTWTVIDKDGRSVNLAGGGTDWEYVYRAGSSAGNTPFTGGNHENERLIDIKFYDDITGDELVLKGREPVNVKNLKIVETTQILFHETETPYCDVVRTYHVVGSQIRLDVDYKYIKDCYHNLSYTCMFPIDKKYGLYCAFVGTDESGEDILIDTITTKKVRAADYSGPFLGKHPAYRCVIWGYEKPEYKFDVRVNTVTDSCDDFKNSDKTFYWDMNTTQNKLYFSKYGSPATLVKAGTTFKTGSMWTFYIDE